MPVPNDLTQFFWDGVVQHKLMILQCQTCGHYIHYPRPVCEACLSEDLAPKEVSGRGTLYSHTVTVQAFHPYWIDKIPYVLATVELVEQADLKMPTNIIECREDQLKVGMAMEVVFEEVAPGLTLPLFRPAQSAQ
jgi:uncharacterized OB-fold protein